MADEFLYSVDLWIILAGSIVVLLITTEIGFRLGRRDQPRINETSTSAISTIQAAMLGLLSLILGFTFAMSMSRFETRKQLVLGESNAIGSTFLRAQLLPEPSQKEISNLLRQYVEVRLEFFKVNINQQKLSEVNDKTEQLHRRLWSLGAASGEKDPRAVTTGLFIQSLNELIDLHTKRITALEDHVPEIILILLYFVAIMAIGLTGYGCGLGGRRNFVVTLVASILIAAVILVIIDLDRPRRGLIRVSQQRMLDLRNNLAND